MASSPRDSQQTDRHQPDTEVRESPSRSSSSLRVLRRQGAAKHKPARRQAAKLCYRFGPLTPSARSANLIAGDGTKNGFPAPNKEPATNQKIRLDRKSPIQVRIRFPPAESLGRGAGGRVPPLRRETGFVVKQSGFAASVSEEVLF